MGKIIVAVITLFLLVAVFQGQFTAGIKGWRTSETTEADIAVTGGGVTSQNITLSYDLYQAALAEVVSLVSTNLTHDTPVASAYFEDTDELTISGLVASQTRTITTVYNAETDDEVMQVLGPFLGILIFGGCVAAIFIGLFSKKRQRF